MIPVICFYKDQWLWSENYLRLEKPSLQSTEDFLLNIEKNYFDQIKILQVDFDAFNLLTRKHSVDKIKYYESPGSLVYILNDHNLLDPNQGLTKITEIAADVPNFNILTTSENFCKKVQSLIQEINQGRFYQVNLTGRIFDGINRTTFVIDEKGKIEKVISDVKSKYHAEQILE